MKSELMRQNLMEWIEGQAEWRENKATEFPDDLRNSQSAIGLRSLAEFVGQMSVDDPLLATFDPCADSEGQFWILGDASSELGRFRFNDPTEGFEAMLSGLPVILLDAREEGLKMSGDWDEEEKAIPESSDPGMTRILVRIPAAHEGSRAIAFLGRWLLNPADDFRSSDPGADAGVRFGVALTNRGQIAVHLEHVNKGPIGFETYADLEEAESDGGLPADIAVLAQVELDPGFVEELDI